MGPSVPASGRTLLPRSGAIQTTIDFSARYKLFDAPFPAEELIFH